MVKSLPVNKSSSPVATGQVLDIGNAVSEKSLHSSPCQEEKHYPIGGFLKAGNTLNAHHAPSETLSQYVDEGNKN